MARDQLGGRMARILKVALLGGATSIFLNTDLVVSVAPVGDGAFASIGWSIKTCSSHDETLVSRKDAARILRSMGYLEPIEDTGADTAEEPIGAATGASSPAQPAPSARLPKPQPFVEPVFADGFVPFRQELPVQPPAFVGSVQPGSSPTHSRASAAGDGESIPQAIQAQYQEAARRYEAWLVAEDDEDFFRDEYACAKAREDLLDALGAIGELCAAEEPAIGRAVASLVESEFARAMADAEVADLVRWIAGEE